MRELSWKDAASPGYETRVLVILISFLKRTLHIQEALVVFIIHGGHVLSGHCQHALE